MSTGSSGTPLAKKLGIEPGGSVGLYNAPPGFAALLEPHPAGVSLIEDPAEACEVFIVFAVTAAELDHGFSAALELLPADGALWVAWPKRASGITTELGFAAVQGHGLEAGLVDNKTCAIDEVWSGLRFVVRVADRAGWPR